MTNNIIPIAMCFDDGYTLPAAATIASILKNCDTADNFHFHIIFAQGRLSSENQEKLRELASIKPFQIDFCPINFEMFNGITPPKNTHFTIETFFRYMIANIVKGYDKCIYLDGDLLILRSLSELYNTDISDYYAAGSLDLSVNENLVKKFNINREKGELYINAGVLLVNSKKWRENNVLQSLFENTTKYQNVIEWADQDIVNITLKGKIKVIDLKYNYPVFLLTNRHFCNFYHKREEFDSALFNIVIAHYITNKKPWNFFDERFRLYNEWFYYAKMTPFRERFDNILAKKEEFKSKTNVSFLHKIIKIDKSYKKRQIYLLPVISKSLLKLRLSLHFGREFVIEIYLGAVEKKNCT